MDAVVSATGVPAKRQTSRIPLDVAKPSPLPGAAAALNAGGPKTIRIKPGGTTVGAVKPPTPDAGPRIPAPAAPSPEVAAAKRTTSRISLEAVFGAEAAPEGGEGGPKTIRLKRPGETGVQKPPSAADAPAGGEESGASPTIKKTVRVKRPTPGAEAAAPAAVARTAAIHRAEESLPGAVNDEPNPVFPLFALAASLVLLVLIYVLLAQCLGPDASLTKISMGAPDFELPWPGKVSVR
jgi:hypothetical protein